MNTTLNKFEKLVVLALIYWHIGTLIGWIIENVV